jgi:hypothetical protein
VTVEETKVIDIISLDKRTGQVILTVSDHLEWNDTPITRKFSRQNSTPIWLLSRVPKFWKNTRMRWSERLSLRLYSSSSPTRRGAHFCLERKR